MESRSLRVNLTRSSVKAVRSIFQHPPPAIHLRTDQKQLYKCFTQKELVDPTNLERIFLSPRQRATKTFELLFDKHRSEIAQCSTGGPVVQITEDVREWDYGEYDGLKGHEILELKPGWNIWFDG